MKKDRNCGMNMPIYPYPMPNMLPGIPGGYMDYPQNNYYLCINPYSSRLQNTVQYLLDKKWRFFLIFLLINHLNIC